MQLYVDLTLPHLGADIVVWPESAVPALEQYIRPFLAAVAGAAQARGSSLVMGLIRRDAATGSHYNSIAGWSVGDPRPAVVRQASPRAFRRVLPRAGPGARVAAADEPAVLGLRARSCRPVPAACGGAVPGTHGLLRGRLWLGAAGTRAAVDVARQRHQRRLVRRLDGPAPAPRHQPHACPRERTRHAARHERRRDGLDRLRRIADRQPAAVRAGRAARRGATACRA